MTTQGRYGKGQAQGPKNGQTQAQQKYNQAQAEGLTRIHIIGTPSEVDAAFTRLSHVLDVVTRSKHIPRREEEGQVTIYITARIDG
ncbi:hypothetical protein [Nonomuraea sp. NPDC049758]|uniref:hypothetical protein n=1 Tax=Nonomuraea sp. NPDC049758 TaxID=3154360 RepID=UPI00342FFC04